MSLRRLLSRLGRVAYLARQLFQDLGIHWRWNGGHLVTIFLRAREQLKLLALRGITADDYYAYALFRPGRTAQEKMAFLGEFQVWRWFYTMNDPYYLILVEDKSVFARLMAAAGVATPQTLAYYDPARNFPDAPTLRDAKSLRQWLSRDQVADLFIKPRDGSKGYGTLSLGRRLGPKPQWESLPTKAVIDLDTVLAHFEANPRFRSYLIQRRLVAHPVLEELTAGVLHTARILTAINSEGEVLVMAAALRIGMGNSPADNLARGGMVAAIDLDSGKLVSAGTLVEGLGQRLERHPMTGIAIAGVTVPFWAEALDLVRRAAVQLHYFRTLGWDVAITAEGPVMLEANMRFDVAVNQVASDQGLLATPFAEIMKKHGAFDQLGLFRRLP